MFSIIQKWIVVLKRCQKNNYLPKIGTLQNTLKGLLHKNCCLCIEKRIFSILQTNDCLCNKAMLSYIKIVGALIHITSIVNNAPSLFTRIKNKVIDSRKN